MIILILFAFISGLFTILAPCIWPLLPIILSSSLAGRDHRRPLGIIMGIMLSFMIFTLSVSYIVKLFHINPDIFRVIGASVITLLGLALIIPWFNTFLEVLVSRVSGRVQPTGLPVNGGFWSGFVTGLSLGLVWSPCAGPILATIATLAATEKVTFQVVLVTFSYVLGVGIPLLIFAYAGRNLVHRSRSISPYTGRIQQVIGVIMIMTAILMYTNKIQDIQLAITSRIPALDAIVNGFEKSDAVKKQLDSLKGGASSLFTFSPDTSDLFNANVKAPEFTGITQWLNNPSGAGIESKPLTLAELRGKVVLVDFWTYTCINCVRTLPHVTKWYDKYKDQGFVVIGVHTPEFAFEKETKNVIGAINKFGIHYPVAQDNDFATWNAYTNQYWPAEYLIDATGTVRRTHFGEGEYDEMEMAIQTLLKEAGKKVDTSLESMPDETPRVRTSPESYLGSKRAEYFIDGTLVDGKQQFSQNSSLPVNSFSLGNEWTITPEYAEAGKNASLTYRFQGEHVYLVMKQGSAKNGKVTVILDGAKIDPSQSGKDVVNGMMTIDEDRLYDIVNLHGKNEIHTLLLIFQTPGVQVYAYTFG